MIQLPIRQIFIGNTLHAAYWVLENTFLNRLGGRSAIYGHIHHYFFALCLCDIIPVRTLALDVPTLGLGEAFMITIL